MNRAEEINRLHDDIMGGVRTTVRQAIQIGELLEQQKAEVGHGAWLPWLAENVHFAVRTAQNYMRIYGRRGELNTHSVAHLTDAYWLLADETPERGSDLAEGLPKGLEDIPEVAEALQRIRASKRQEALARRSPSKRKVGSRSASIEVRTSVEPVTAPSAEPALRGVPEPEPTADEPARCPHCGGLL
jgi:hypothetical protein